MTTIKSIKEKAKAYDKAIEKIQKYVKDDYGCIRLRPEDIFPELKESEGEKIRKELVQFFEEKDEEDFEEWIPKAKVLAWLEKQGEQKSADKKGMNLVEGEMTPFQKEVFYIIDTTIEEEQGLKQVCDKLLRLAHNEIMIKQNPAWSEEDKKKVNSLYVLLDQMVSFNMLSDKDANEFKDWLKSLKERYTWKPSDEQIKLSKKQRAIVLCSQKKL